VVAPDHSNPRPFPSSNTLQLLLEIVLSGHPDLVPFATWRTICASKRRRSLPQPRILVAESYPALLEATIALLKFHFDVVGSVADGVALVEEARRLCPDVIVSEISLPLLNGIDAVHQLRESISPFRIVFLTVHAEQEFINACVAEGALGYVLKSQMKAHLIPAVQAVLAGTSYIYPFAAK